MKNRQNRSWIEIDTEQFIKNIHFIKSALPTNCEYLQLVKADGYGHGGLEIAKASEKEGINYFGVANAKEGAFLRDNGIKGNILIVGPSFEDEINIILKKKLIPSISNVEFVKKLSQKAHYKVPVHIEIDTGMGRGGILYYNAVNEIKKIAKLQNIHIEGIFSHFPNADSVNKFSKEQIKIFSGIINELKKNGLNFKFIHLANSGGFLYYPDSIFNMVRIGILSFGYFPGKKLKKIPVRPIMSFYSRIVLIKDYKKGAYISYGSTFKVKRRSRIGIIPLGYADGVFRALSNRGEVIVKGQKFPIIGNISMDMFMIDLTDSIEAIEKGDIATLIGCQNQNCIDADAWAEILGTINYEVLTSIGKRSLRLYKYKRKSTIAKSYNEKFFEKSLENSSVTKILEDEYGLDLSRDLKEQLAEKYLKNLFGNAYDHFRDNFVYDVKLVDLNEKFYRAIIHISFKKWINSSNIMLGVTNNNERLEKMMHDKHFIYRWFMQKSNIKETDFNLKSISIDGEKIKNYRKILKDDLLEFHIGKRLKIRNLFDISMTFETYYPKKYRVFPVYFSDFTKNALLKFSVNSKKMNYFSFFTGKNLKINSKKNKNEIKLTIAKNKYIYPESGIIFYWE